MYYYLKLTRQFEDRLRVLYRQGRFPGSVYLSTGQEAIPVGCGFALEPRDAVAPSHRDLALHFIRGLTPREILAQYMGKKTGPTRGKDGNIHFGNMKTNTLGFISSMAAGMPVALGAALAFKMRGEDRVAAVFFGDGAASTGTAHESLNFAAVFRLPVIFVCNNNQYAYSVPVEKQMAIRDIAERAKGYGFPGVVVDGNDVLAVYRACREAVGRARGGGGPTLLECKTMRMSGHGEHDSAFYVPSEKFAEWKRKDPVDRFERYLIEHQVVDRDKIQEIVNGDLSRGHPGGALGGDGER
ncbi:MAG: thiamine pyrophosphate-dependent dehydrogenase E1 component subunit alpha [Deltaproteobacteria bacterium]|nr:thiamine pyrophosphate-dependent dehydrogenase E1 component subunit alpha [Deltaproteobacteria bacterium]